MAYDCQAVAGLITRAHELGEYSEGQFKEVDVAVMVGVPLAGKSTLSRYLKEKYRYVVVCPDTVRTAIHGRQFIHSAEPFVWATVEAMVRVFLTQGDKVVVDATNTHPAARQKWLRIAKEFDKTVGAFVVQTPFSVSYERNEELQRLDPSVIDRMVKQFKAPSVDEGFDVIYDVYSDSVDDYYFAERNS